MELLDYLVKINSDHGITYVLIRTIILYIFAILLIRVGNKRFHFETTIDVILLIVIGSILSRSINGSSTLFAGMSSSALLIFLHWFFANIAFHSKSFGKIVKGKPEILIKNGKLIDECMRNNQVTKEDILEMVRERLHDDDLNNIKEARLERTGRISFVKKTT